MFVKIPNFAVATFLLSKSQRERGAVEHIKAAQNEARKCRSTGSSQHATSTGRIPERTRRANRTRSAFQQLSIIIAIIQIDNNANERRLSESQAGKPQQRVMCTPHHQPHVATKNDISSGSQRQTVELTILCLNR
jgi:hypothetical protein